MKKTVEVCNYRLGTWGFYPDNVANDMEARVEFRDGSGLPETVRVYDSVSLVDDDGEPIAGLTFDQAATELLANLRFALELAINAVIAAHDANQKVDA